MSGWASAGRYGGGLATTRWKTVTAIVLPVVVLSCSSPQLRREAPRVKPVDVPEPAAPTTSTAGEAAGVYHVVQRGETLWRIARAYGLTVEALAEANAIEDPARIDTGQRLFVPGAKASIALPATTSGAAVRTGASFLWPVPNGRVLSYFGAARRRHSHKGLDIGASHGVPVIAARAGRVVYSGSTMRGYGKTIILDHGGGLTSLYAHNSALLVKTGDWVESGQRIARVGRTGNASTDHCHFEIRRREVPVDPMPLIAREDR